MAFLQPNFDELFNNWVRSGYDKMLKPSPDRLDNSKPYTLDNLELVTWAENDRRGHEDMRNGVIISGANPQRPVLSVNIVTGKILRFHSMCEAERQTGAHSTHIGDCCNGRRNYASGYYWKYE